MARLEKLADKMFLDNKGNLILRYTDAAGKQQWEKLGVLQTEKNKLDLKDAGIQGITQTAASKILVDRLKFRNDGIIENRTITFKAFVNEWYKGLDVRERTLQGYKHHTDLMIDPKDKDKYANVKSFGNTKLRHITPSTIDDFLNSLEVSASTKASYLRTLRVILNAAVKRDYLAKNPAKAIKAPKRKKKDIEVLTAAEINKLIASTPKEHQALIMTACFTGVRRGELLGLTWDRVDFNGSFISVRYALHNGKLGELKSEASKRKIIVPGVLLKALKALQLRQRAELHTNELNLVFTAKSVIRDTSKPIGKDKDGNTLYDILRGADNKTLYAGTPMDGKNMVKRIFKPALAFAGLRVIRFHDIRHSFASNLLSRGVDIKTVQTVLGHSSAMVTLDVYGHCMPNNNGYAYIFADAVLNDPEDDLKGIFKYMAKP